ncbi:MAG: c-type cytochrome [Campylobacterales bacterium]|nr:c-type cytochrome [Campylobacterales bacterium]
MKTLLKTTLGLALLGALSLVSADGAATFKKCTACHGVNAEKKALGKSAVIAGWETEKTIAALKGYKDGTYGGTMKALMKGQVAALNDTQIEEVAAYIATKK